MSVPAAHSIMDMNLHEHENIDFLKNENLQLKVKIHNLIKSGPTPSDSSGGDDIERDLVATLLTRCEKYRQELEKRDKKDRTDQSEKKKNQQDVSCQTNLDRMNIEDLLRASVALKKIKEQERMNSRHTESHLRAANEPFQPMFARNEIEHLQTPKNKQPQQIVTQLSYPSVKPLQRQTACSTKHLRPDEKSILDYLYKLDGEMTVNLDKLTAVTDNL